MRIRLVVAATGLVAFAGAIVPAFASPAGGVPTDPCLISKPTVTLSSNSTTVNLGTGCPSIVVPVGLPRPAAVSGVPTLESSIPPPCPVHPPVWISNGNLYIQYGCTAPVVIQLPGIKPPPTA